MPSKHSEQLEFINTDLDIYVTKKSGPLLDWLRTRTIEVSSEGGRFTFELNRQPKTLSASLRAFARLIEKMPPDVRTLWSACKRRSFDIGMRRKAESTDAQLSIVTDRADVALVSKIGGEIALTLYPEE